LVPSVSLRMLSAIPSPGPIYEGSKLLRLSALARLPPVK
jgi:hypothetical protein